MEASHRENMILYNVLNQEKVFQEYFCNLLNIQKFRDLFINFISEKNNILDNYKINYNNFYTEEILDNKFGRADLFLRINEQKFIFEIKNKNNTGLTDHQPCSYLKYLDNKNQHLFFLIPNTYNHIEEIYKRWHNFNDIENQIFYWEDFIRKIKNSNITSEYKEIEFFYEFCQDWFMIKTVEFKEDEMELLKDNAVPRLMSKLESIIINVADVVGLKEDADAVGFNYTKKVGDYKLYFGIDYDTWEQKNMPLRILIQNHKKSYGNFKLKVEGIGLEPFHYKETSIMDEQFGYLVLCKEVIDSENYENIIIQKIKNIIKELNKNQT